MTERKPELLIIGAGPAGSSPRELPLLPFDGKNVLSSDDALKMTELPESMIILGGGAIGCEFAHILGSFGVRITVVEMLDRILPASDGEVVQVLERSFRRRKIKIMTGTKAVSSDISGSGVVLEVIRGEKKERLAAEKILVVTGRRPNTAEMGLETAGITLENGFIPVGPFCQTGIEGIFAAGDIVAGPMLAHRASKQAVMEMMKGLSGGAIHI